MSLKYRTSAGTSASNFSDLVVKVGDTLPIGSEIDYDGQTAPAGWQEVAETNLGDVVVDSIRSKNLFNKNILWNAWINVQGQLVESASNRVSDYIYVYGMDYITISGGTSDAVIEAFYDSSKTFVSYAEVSSSSTTLQVPNNAYYLRVTVKPAALNTYQIEEGSVATTYKPYQELDNKDVYSTGETRIGKWIDGKPLYRRTIFSTTKTGSLGLSNVDFLRWKNFNAFINNEILFPDARYISTTTNDKLDFFVNKTRNSFTLTLGSTWDSNFTYLVFDIEYTKTTD